MGWFKLKLMVVGRWRTQANKASIETEQQMGLESWTGSSPSSQWSSGWEGNGPTYWVINGWAEDSWTGDGWSGKQNPTDTPTLNPTGRGPGTPLPTDVPTLGPTYEPTPVRPPFIVPTVVECPVGTKDCVCGECVDGSGDDDEDGTYTCEFEEGKGSNKPADICFKPVGPLPSPCVRGSILSVTFSPRGNGGCRERFLLDNDPRRCRDGWLVSKPREDQNPECSDQANNNIVLKSECAGVASIHTSCSCPIGMCYIFGNYQITGYTLHDSSTPTFYKADR